MNRDEFTLGDIGLSVFDHYKRLAASSPCSLTDELMYSRCNASVSRQEDKD
jgi:hypothetical protein